MRTLDARREILASADAEDGAGEDAREALRHERDPSVIREAARRWWPDVPCVSGGELAAALRRLGLEAKIGGPDHAVLVCSGAAVAVVPLSDPVHPAIVRALLRALGITPAQLARCLAED